MNKKPIILGIESSCDETAASIVTENEQGIPTILSSIVSSQVDVHKEFGGVVPELAARSHIEKIDSITKKAIDDSGIKLEDIDAIATTAGPGLIVCLSVGLSFGKAMASSLNKPFIAVNHLEGHALSPKLNSELNYPYLLLLISGGHTQFLSVQGLGDYKRLGTTIDDAVGEAFDKTAKLLGIEFPGGPQIEIYAKKGDPNKYTLPKPIYHRGGCNLSFAGLKTAVLKISKQIKTDQEKYDLAASFQRTIEEILYKKRKIAFEEFKKMNETSKDKNETNKNKFVVAGGVAANKRIREVLEDLCKKEGFEAIFPPIHLCGDNAAMIAMVGLEKFKLNQFSELDHPTKPRWALDEDAAFLKGAGVKF
jgi:N6-L-threonylcarbamoyladenine synthase